MFMLTERCSISAIPFACHKWITCSSIETKQNEIKSDESIHNSMLMLIQIELFK